MAELCKTGKLRNEKKDYVWELQGDVNLLLCFFFVDSDLRRVKKKTFYAKKHNIQWTPCSCKWLTIAC